MIILYQRGKKASDSHQIIFIITATAEVDSNAEGLNKAITDD